MCFIFVRSLELYRKVPNLRILACGGDGTVSYRVDLKCLLYLLSDVRSPSRPAHHFIYFHYNQNQKDILSDSKDSTECNGVDQLTV